MLWYFCLFACLHFCLKVYMTEHLLSIVNVRPLRLGRNFYLHHCCLCFSTSFSTSSIFFQHHLFCEFQHSRKNCVAHGSFSANLAYTAEVQVWASFPRNLGSYLLMSGGLLRFCAGKSEMSPGTHFFQSHSQKHINEESATPKKQVCPLYFRRNTCSNNNC